MVGRSLAVLEYHLVNYRRIWVSTMVSSLTTPMLLLLALGVFMGGYVNRGGTLSVPYLHYLAPALLASACLQLAMTEAGIQVTSQFKWKRTYFGMGATPLRASEMIIGELSYLAMRMAIAAAIFLTVMLAFGAVHSAWALVVPVAAVLTGLAGAAPMYAYAATVETSFVMAVMLRFVMLPMTLFSGVFFPVEQLPVVARLAAYALPLWHGVVLCRDATLGTGALLPALGHVAVLVAWTAVGFDIARRRFGKRLTA